MGVRKLFGAASSRKSLRSDKNRHGAADPPPRPRAGSRASADIAGYIAQMSEEMGMMAGAARLDVLAYLLAMARAEAQRSARSTRSNQQETT